MIPAPLAEGDTLSFKRHLPIFLISPPLFPRIAIPLSSCSTALSTGYAWLSTA
ncbi:hypothetical protein HMPREF9134_01109 [Porphyromonas catoniae F0037]|uniref:Uncharacterized protein n=1 Tax=Porphyromonas catoniae F0037 TaxID=1127696 RepID=L1NCF5_9PORP|nr:hypothetical protein HMPREF9134_01109 [Porphyromonas catoniae F0037]